MSAVKAAPVWSQSGSQSGDNWRLHSIKFVLFRFHGGAYYWGLCFLARSGLVTAATLLKDPFSQILMLAVVMTIYAFFQCAIWPWKSLEVNLLDATASVLLITMLLSATRLVGSDNGGVNRDMVTQVIMTCYISLVAVFFFYVVYLLVQMVQLRNPNNRKSLEQKKEKALSELGQELRNLGNMMATLDEETMVKTLKSLTVIDIGRLERVQDAFNLEAGVLMGAKRVRLRKTRVRTGSEMVLSAENDNKSAPEIKDMATDGGVYDGGDNNVNCGDATHASNVQFGTNDTGKSYVTRSNCSA